MPKKKVGKAATTFPSSPAGLREARRAFLDRLGQSLEALRGEEIPEDPTAGERKELAAGIRKRIERREADRQRILARIDAEIERDRELMARLEGMKPAPRPPAARPVHEVKGIGDVRAGALKKKKIRTVGDLAGAEESRVASALGTSKGVAKKLIREAKKRART